MNSIKTAKRNCFGDILRALMMIYTARPEELQDLDRDAMAKHVAHKVWTGKIPNSKQVRDNNAMA